MESCALINNTHEKYTEEIEEITPEEEDDEDPDAYERRGRVHVEGEVRSLSIDFNEYPTGEGADGPPLELEEKKLMCAPIERAGRKGARGPVVTAALEIEAESFDLEWRSEDEDTFRVVAMIAGSILDIVDHIKEQVAKSQGFIGASYLSRANQRDDTNDSSEAPEGRQSPVSGKSSSKKPARRPSRDGRSSPKSPISEDGHASEGSQVSQVGSPRLQGGADAGPIKPL